LLTDAPNGDFFANEVKSVLNQCGVGYLVLDKTLEAATLHPSSDKKVLVWRILIMSEPLIPANHQRPTRKRKDKFSEIHKLVFKVTFTVWVLYEFLKFLRFLWLTW
jgi:hypothetical protein